MKKITYCALAGMIVAAAFCAALVGCDEAKGLVGLTLSPSQVTLTSVSNKVEVMVVGNTNNIMALPLHWSVSDSSLGYIAQATGFKALYFSHSGMYGDNIITARDQYENEGYCTVRQVEGFGSVMIETSKADTNTWVLTITNPTDAPYEWWVHNPTIGSISSSGNGYSAVYESKEDDESNTVYARSAVGEIGSATIP